MKPNLKNLNFQNLSMFPISDLLTEKSELEMTEINDRTYKNSVLTDRPVHSKFPRMKFCYTFF